jgi:hypothetical protein
VSPVSAYSLTSGATVAELRFIASSSASVASEHVNSPVASTLRSVSLRPVEENITIGGESLTALKKLYGARFTTPDGLTELIQPMGRGAAMALNGSWRSPCFRCALRSSVA